MEMTSALSDILNQTAEEFANAEVFSSWMPPDGSYTVLLTDAKAGVSDKPDNVFGWMRLSGKILDDTNPELHEKDFTVGYYTTKAPGILKGAVSVLAGKTVTNINEAAAILDAAVGKVVVVEVATKRSRKNNQDYTNCDILRIVDTGAAPAPEAAPAPTA